MSAVRNESWLITPDGQPRGYIKPHALKELWFHTGTRCNLECGFCLEGSSPSDNRLQAPRFEEIKPFIDDAVEMGVDQFSFTGGEPFLIKDFIKIIEYASQFNPCLILTNGTDSPLKRLDGILAIDDNHHPISFRVSLDYANAKQHNLGRGEGNFEQALTGLKRLHQSGFPVSIARHMASDENTVLVEKQFKELLSLNGLPDSLNIIAFPDFLTPGSITNVPYVSSHCMTTYQTTEQRANYMCATSKMIIKKNDLMQVYACTLVDDDEDYFLGTSLKSSLNETVSLKHHRCYSCFALGASCSER